MNVSFEGGSDRLYFSSCLTYLFVNKRSEYVSPGVWSPAGVAWGVLALAAMTAAEAFAGTPGVTHYPIYRPDQLFLLLENVASVVL